MAGWGGVGGQRSCWSTQGAPRYPVIHDNQREMEGQKVGRGKVRETEREGEHGKAQLRSESAQLEQNVKNKAASDFHFFPSLSALYCPQTGLSFL